MDQIFPLSVSYAITVRNLVEMVKCYEELSSSYSGQSWIDHASDLLVAHHTIFM